MTLTILGIDPGSQCTGYGIISVKGTQTHCVTYGQISIKSGTLSERLKGIYQQLNQIIATYQPQEAAIEQVFIYKNSQSALKLGQARGSAMIATAMHNLPLSEYAPRQIKQAVVGYGAADKNQMQHMVKILLNLPEKPPTDAADALAIALCHCHSRNLSRKLAIYHKDYRKGE